MRVSWNLYPLGRGSKNITSVHILKKILEPLLGVLENEKSNFWEKITFWSLNLAF